jgi:hypothetical protein
MENLLSISLNKHLFRQLLILVTLLTSGLSFGSSYEVNKATELYNNGEFKRAKTFLTGIDLSKDYVGSYMMGAISLQDDEITLKSKIDNAIYWFQISADLGFAQAYHALGRAYEQRWLNNKNSEDINQSKSNYKLAYSKGFFQAKSDILRLEPGYEFSDEMETTVPPEIKLAEEQSNAKSSITSKTSDKNRSDGLFSGFQANTAIAQEAPRAYWGAGGALMTLDDGFDSFEPINAFGRVGYDFNAYIGVGAEVSFSLIEDDVAGIDFSVDTRFFFLKGSLPIGDGAKLYAMIGPSNVELTGSIGGFSVSLDDSDIGIGFGFEKSLNDSFGISVDYINYYNDSGFDVISADVDVDAFNIGVVGYF